LIGSLAGIGSFAVLRPGELTKPGKLPADTGVARSHAAGAWRKKMTRNLVVRDVTEMASSWGKRRVYQHMPVLPQLPDSRYPSQCA
jgi:hypothetical protein